MRDPLRPRRERAHARLHLPDQPLARRASPTSAALGQDLGERMHLEKLVEPALGDSDATSLVDGKNVPVRHFGVILGLPDWESLAAKLTAAGMSNSAEPPLRNQT